MENDNNDLNSAKYFDRTLNKFTKFNDLMRVPLLFEKTKNKQTAWSPFHEGDAVYRTERKKEKNSAHIASFAVRKRCE